MKRHIEPRPPAVTAAQRRALLEAAAKAVRHAHAPYSKYRVGAAVLTGEGLIFSGCNVENASYGLTVCAERVAVFSAIAAGCSAITALAVVAGGAATPYPCGACRQVLAEFCRPETPIYVVQSGRSSTLKLGRLLPLSFRLLPS